MTLLGQPGAYPFDRLGIIASRRLGGAVVRNRAKRRLREVFRQGEATRQDAPSRPLDLVAIPRRELLMAPMPMLTIDFWTAVRRLRGGR